MRLDQAGHDQTGRLIAHQAIGEAIEHHGGVRRMAIEDELQDRPHARHLVGGQRRLAEHAREAAGFQQPIALAQRQIERLGQHQQRVAARLRAAGLDEAHVLRRKT